MRTDPGRGANEAQVRKLIEDRAAAVSARDVDGALASFAPDVLVFDVVDPLRYSRADTVRARAEQWFASFEGAIGYEIAELSIAAGDDLASSHSLNRVAGTLSRGGRLEMWWRSSTCYRRIDGR